MAGARSNSGPTGGHLFLARRLEREQVGLSWSIAVELDPPVATTAVLAQRPSQHDKPFTEPSVAQSKFRIPFVFIAAQRDDPAVSRSRNHEGATRLPSMTGQQRGVVGAQVLR